MSRFLNQEYSRLAPYTPGEQPQNREYIKLNTNESPFAPSAKVEQAVLQEVQQLNLYPDPNCSVLCKALAQHFSLQADNVFVGNGSDEILAFCFQGFCADGVAFADLTYGFYPVYAQLYHVNSQVIPLSNTFMVTPSDYFGLGKTIFIANPNAPTGLALSLCDIEDVLLNNPSSLGIIDEAYVDFGACSAVSLLAKYDNLLVIGTFSKSRSLAGGRIGYALGNSQLIADLNRIKFSFNPYNINRLSLAAGTAAVEDEGYFKKCCQEIIATRKYTINALRELGFTCTDSMANFVFASHPAHAGEKLYLGLKEHGVLVRWFNQPRIENYLRITIGTKPQMDALLDALTLLLNNGI